MTQFQAQAWICPVCFDDHGGRDCKVDDLKAEIAKLRAEVAEVRYELGDALMTLQAAESAFASIRTLARSWSGRHDLVMTGDSAAHDIEAALAATTTAERSEG